MINLPPKPLPLTPSRLQRIALLLVWGFIAAVCAAVDTGSFFAGVLFTCTGVPLTKWAFKGVFDQSDTTQSQQAATPPPIPAVQQPSVASSAVAAPNKAPWASMGEPIERPVAPPPNLPSSFEVRKFG